MAAPATTIQPSAPSNRDATAPANAFAAPSEQRRERDPHAIGHDEDVEAEHQPREQADLEAAREDAEVERDAERRSDAATRGDPDGRGERELGHEHDDRRVRP